jgi:hypothetical protein
MNATHRRDRWWRVVLHTARRRAARFVFAYVVMMLSFLAVKTVLPREIVASPPTFPAGAESTLQQLTRLHACTTGDLPPGVAPAHAIVRDPDRNIRLTSFGEGWDMYVGRRPGTLMSVCGS